MSGTGRSGTGRSGTGIIGTGLAIRDLTVAYQRHPAIHHVSLDLAPGSMTAIVGANGAGKSTLLKAIAGLIRPVGGGVECRPPRSRIAYLPQQAEVERGFPISVADAVLFGSWRTLGWSRAAGAAELASVSLALDAVGLAGFDRRIVGTLSAGQFQRMLFARLLLQDAPLILLDEPFNALDERTARDLLAIMQAWHAEGRTVLAVLHDFDMVRRSFPTAVLLARELIAAGPAAEVLSRANLDQARGIAAAWDESAALCHAPVAAP